GTAPLRLAHGTSPLPGRRPAFDAELRAGQRRPAVPAEFPGRLRRGQRVAAALAELAAAAFLPAARAQARALVPVVDVPGPVLALDLLVQLIDLRGGLQAGYLLGQLGGAGRAQAPFGVPADLPAHPLPAAVALVEVRLHLIDRPGERLVAGRPAGAVAHPLGVPAELRGLLADAAANQVAAQPEQPAAEPGSRVLKGRSVTVAAASAEELELISVVGAAVLVVVSKEDHPGQGSLPFGCQGAR